MNVDIDHIPQIPKQTDHLNKRLDVTKINEMKIFG